MGFSRQEYWSVLPFSSPGESSQPRDWTWVSCIVGGCFTVWATREVHQGKTITLTRWTFVGKVTSLLFDMLSRLVIALLPRSKRLLISWLQSPSTVILESKIISLSLFPLFPHLFAMKWLDRMPWSQFIECWVLSHLFYSPLTFMKRLSISSSLSAIRMVSSVYLSLLISLLAILIPGCALSSLAFHMLYSAYKLNKQGDSIQAWCAPFLVVPYMLSCFSCVWLFMTLWTIAH